MSNQMKKPPPTLSILILITTALACRTLTGGGGEPAIPLVESPAVPSPTVESQPAAASPTGDIQPADTQADPPTQEAPTQQQTEAQPTMTEEPPRPENIVPVSEAQEITLESAPQVPDDILEQIGMFQGYGAGFDACFPFAVDQQGVFQWDEYTYKDGASVPVTDLDLTWCACGFADDLIDAQLITPDGEIQPLEVLEGEISEPGNRCPMLWWSIEPGMPLGEYQVQLSQDGQVLEDHFTLEIPDDPTGVWMDGSAWLVGFQPGERIRVLVYGQSIGGLDMEVNVSVGRYEFLGETLTEADQSGTLLLNINEAITQQYVIYVAAISDSGQTAVASMNPVLGESLLKLVSKDCGAALPPQLKVGDSALVVREELLLNAEPFHEAITALGYLPNGSLVNVVDGPVCEVYDPEGESYWLWKVETQDDQTGWVIEVDHVDYALLPGE
jgi:hypothetical protein